MAIVMRMSWAGVTREQYEQVRQVTAFETDAPDGGIIHLAWFDDDGLRVTDVWESADQFQTFVAQRLMPAVAQVGIESEPVVEILPAYYTQVVATDGDRTGAIVTDGDLGMPAPVYDALAAKVDWANVPPVGGICHIVGQTEDGTLLHTTAWLSEAAHDSFDADRIAPAARELVGEDAEPPDAGPIYPLHNLFDAAGARV